MNIKQLWMVGFEKKESLKIAFRMDLELNNENYVVDFLIPSDKKDYIINKREETIVMNKIKDIEFTMIARAEGIRIKERLENNSEFKSNIITPIILQELLNNEIYVNIELNKDTCAILT